MGIIATRSLDEQVTGLKDLKAQHEARIRSGMLAYDALEALRSDGSNAEARATFERHRADLGYGLLLTPMPRRLARRTRRPSPGRSTIPFPRWRRCSGASG